MAMRKTRKRTSRSTSRRFTTRNAKARKAVSRKSSTRRASSRKASPRRGTNGGNIWSSTDIAFMRKNYRTHSTAWCARQLGRTVYSVRYKASDLSIKKGKPSVWKDTPTQKKTTRRATKRSWAKTTHRTSVRRKSRSRR